MLTEKKEFRTMGLNAYAKVKAKQQGDIKGSCDIEQHKEEIEIWGWSHEVLSPRDAASGAPTGKRQHKPFTVTKPVDKSSPLLMSSLVNNEELTEVTMVIYRPSPSGTEEHYYTIKLEGGKISTIRQEKLNNNNPE